MEISKLAAVSGQGGLFQITTALKNGVILESVDEKKLRLVAGAQSKVSVLSEISIYTTTAEGSVPLEDVLKSIYGLYQENIPVNPKSDGADLKDFLLSVLKEADIDRVYPSDIKKLVSWYLILCRFAPEVLGAGQEAVAETSAKPKASSKAKKQPASKA